MSSFSLDISSIKPFLTKLETDRRPKLVVCVFINYVDIGNIESQTD